MANIEHLDDDVILTMLPHMKPAEIVNLLKALPPVVKDSVMTRLSSSKKLEHIKLYIEIYKARFGVSDALRHAVERGHTDVIRKICQIDREACDRALIDAVWLSDKEVVRILLRSGADIHANNDRALLDAVLSRDLAIVRTLLDAGADPNADNGYTLSLAVDDNQIELVRILLEYGAVSNDSVMLIANRVGNSEILSALTDS
jgi:ankyrin repeat protein